MRELMTPMNNPEFSKRTLSRLSDSFDYLYEVPDVSRRVVVVGFCFGGTYTYCLAVNEPRLKLDVPFYGHCDFSVDELAQVNCPVRAFYGEKDDGLIEQIKTLPATMKKAGVDYSQKVYSNCGHAFFNDTNRFAYDKHAADDAWQILLSELSKI
jgi:carboxymethylenebutenolidase